MGVAPRIMDDEAVLPDTAVCLLLPSAEGLAAINRNAPASALQCGGVTSKLHVESSRSHEWIDMQSPRPTVFRRRMFARVL